MAHFSDEIIVHCTSCGRRQIGLPDLCEHCGAPLTPHASTDPILGIMARGFAAYEATRRPRKLIVVLGMWLWMAPMALFALVISSMAFSFTLQGIVEGQALNVALGLLAVTVMAAWALVPAAILFRTTEAYLRGRSSVRADAAAASEGEDDENAETTNCLACGQSIAEDSTSCAACGWSFSKFN